MNSKVGSTIKKIAIVGVYIGIIASIITGIVFIGLDEDLMLTGFLIAALGSLFVWISSILIYGFGQLVSNSTLLIEQLTKGASIHSSDHIQQIKMYDMLMAKGLLTEEQYKQRIAELQ